MIIRALTYLIGDFTVVGPLENFFLNDYKYCSLITTLIDIYI